MKQHAPRHTSPAHTRASFYTALSGYIDAFSPLPTAMIGRSYADRPAESWLELAERLASQLAAQERSAFAIIERVKKLVRQRQFDEARAIVRQGAEEADSEIRQHASELSR